MKKTNFELTKLLRRAEQLLPVLEQTNLYLATLIRAVATCETCETREVISEKNLPEPVDRCEKCNDFRNWSPNEDIQCRARGFRNA